MNELNIIPKQLAPYIDHTLLKPDATREMVKTLCREAAGHHFASVCVNPSWVSLCSDLLKDSDVKVCTVIGFPLGANTPQVKAAESLQALEDGADELDMVINIGALKSGRDADVETDIRAVTDTLKNYPRSGGGLVKVIIETCLLSRDEIIRACRLSEQAGAQYVKTSTGFSSGGAKTEDVALMKETVGSRLKVKASGGVRDFNAAVAMIRAGASRIGTSSGVKIVSAE